MPDLPVRRLECCCTDCRKGLEWCAAKAGQPLPKLTDAVYFANAVRVDQGPEGEGSEDSKTKLACYLIKEGYNTRRIVATCCWTCMLGDHPVYQGKRFISYANSATIQLIQDEETNSPTCPKVLIPAERRIFQTDLDPETLATLAPFEPPPKEEIPAPDDAEVAILNAEKMVAGGDYMTVQDLMEELGEVQFMDPDFDGPVPAWNKQSQG